ncbi:MAG: hypothetical protein Tsb002_24660 [Wenzhouxiangellaceae bacterium]
MICRRAIYFKQTQRVMQANSAQPHRKAPLEDSFIIGKLSPVYIDDNNTTSPTWPMYQSSRGMM